MGGLTKLLELRKILAGTDKPMSQIRDVGQAFTSRNPNTFFETFKRPAEDTESALAQYGVRFVPRSKGKMSALFDNNVYGVKQVNPETWNDDQEALFELSPSIRRLLNDSSFKNRLYEIEAGSSNAGSGVGSRMYPAIFDVASGGQELVNTPIQLTAINEMRRSANSADAMIRNPKLSNLILPMDQQLNVLRITPEEYMSFDHPEKVGALILASSLKALNRGDRFASDVPFLPDKLRGNAQEALRRFESLSPTSSRGAFAEAAMLPIRERGIGESTMRRMNIVDSILASRRHNPDLWNELGKRRGGRVV